MKRTAAVLFSVILLFVLSPAVFAADGTEESLWYDGIYGLIDSDTAELLESFGIRGADSASLSGVSPDSVLNGLKELIGESAAYPLKNTAAVIMLMLVLTFAVSFLPDGSSAGELAGLIGSLCVISVLLTSVGRELEAGFKVIKLSGNFMLSLIPVYCALAGLAGSPAAALGFGTVTAAFAEAAGLIFSGFIPSMSVFGTAVAAASAIDPVRSYSGISRLFQKISVLAAGFTAAVFTAVLSVKDVIGDSADSVGLKGLKFLIGGVVPVVGSAISDALGTAVAGLGMIKNTAGIFAVLVLAAISLPALITVSLRRLALLFISSAADILGRKEIREFADALGGLCSVAVAAICFDALVYIIALVLVIR